MTFTHEISLSYLIQDKNAKLYLLLYKTPEFSTAMFDNYFMYRTIEITSSNNWKFDRINPLSIDNGLDSGKMKVVPWSEFYESKEHRREAFMKLFRKKTLKDWGL